MKKYITMVFLFLLTFMIGSVSVDAASLGISVSTKSVVRGGKVVVRVNASDVMGKMSLTTSNSGVLSGGTSSVWIENETKTFTFQANSAGSATITVNAIDMSDTGGNAYRGSQSITINVYNPAPVILSSNNNLGSLGIDGKELTPGFSQDVLEYSVEMEPETTKVNVVGWVADGSASVAGLGEREVVDGANRLEVVVTAQNGTSKTYIINVNVKEYNPIEVDVAGKKYTVIRKKSQLTAPPNYVETTVKIGEEDIHAFHSEITGYTLIGLKDDKGNSGLYVYENNNYMPYSEHTFSKIVFYPLEPKDSDIPVGYEKTDITYNDQKIVAYKTSELSKYSLLYGMNVETGKVNMYMYDEVEKTLQIYNDEVVKSLEKELEQMKLIVAALAGGCGFLLLLCIIIGASKGKSNKNGLDSIDDIQVTQLAGNSLSKREEKRLKKEEQLRKQEEDKKFRKAEKKRLKEEAKKLKEELKQEKKNKKNKKEKDQDIDIRQL